VLNGAQVGKTLVVSGDGRFYNDVAIGKIIKIAAANRVGKVVIGEHGTIATPAVSRLIRHYNEEESKDPICIGGILLTASHNPGGEHGDFGIKFNEANGGPAKESLTEAVWEVSKKIDRFLTVPHLEHSDLTTIQNTKYFVQHLDGTQAAFEVDVIDRVKQYCDYMETLFDLGKIKALLSREDFKICFDGMHGVSGPYARELFVNRLGVSEHHLMRCNILPDFGGAHPDPNLTYAPELVDTMAINHPEREGVPDFGAACDGDMDRNMVLGKKFFVTPSDSLAVIVA
jgi:phosphoglucomutase